MAQQIFVCNDIEMKDGDVRIVRQDRIEVGVYRHDGAFYAYRNHCLHQGGPACEGIVRGKVVDIYAQDKTFVAQTYDDDEPHIICPWHGWEYKLKTGECAPDPKLRLRKPRGGATRRRHLCRHLTCSIASGRNAHARRRGARRGRRRSRPDPRRRAARADRQRREALRGQGGDRHAHAAAAGRRRPHRHRNDAHRHRSSACAERAGVRAQHVAGDERQLHRAASAGRCAVILNSRQPPRGRAQ